MLINDKGTRDECDTDATANVAQGQLTLGGVNAWAGISHVGSGLWSG